MPKPPTPEHLQAMLRDLPLLQAMADLQPIFWNNPDYSPTPAEDGPCTPAAIADASARLRRFAPYIARKFPETAAYGGLLESPLHKMTRLREVFGPALTGTAYVKLDSHLPVSGSIKSRGGIYEVLHHAETLALRHNLLRDGDDYARLDSDEARAFFGKYSIAVGSTGNLGLSIGLMSATLGFAATVHMSADARQWKKDRLREQGVTVVEYPDDYCAAVAAGRALAAADPCCHFVDDEDSLELFLGYAVAGERLAAQLDAEGLQVDAAHPLFVYLPCGVGGGPGGVTAGLKQLYGPHVHCYFVEPTHVPAVSLGLLTGLDEGIHCHDLGLDGLTAADGLAVGRPSGLACRVMRQRLAGCVTVPEDALFRLLAFAADLEGIELEPSAAASLYGLEQVLAHCPEARLPGAIHIAWATGGSMVPADERRGYVEKGRRVADTGRL